MLGAAFVLGLVGSLHCVGMCGPIALALPFNRSRGRAAFLLSVLVYNLGRVVTYSFMGFVFAYFAFSLRFAGLQQSVSIISGIILLLVALNEFFHLRIPFLNRYSTQLLLRLKYNLTIFLKKKGSMNLFMIGLLNGLLPCGFVYMALAASNIHSTFLGSIGFMAFFGLGTMPAMMLLSASGKVFNIGKMAFVRKAYPYLLGIIALVLVARGLNLGIPYISPSFNTETCTMDCCHRKH